MREVNDFALHGSRFSDCQKVTDFCIRLIEAIPCNKGNLSFIIGKRMHQLGLIAGYFEQIFYMNHVVEAYGTASKRQG